MAYARFFGDGPDCLLNTRRLRERHSGLHFLPPWSVGSKKREGNIKSTLVRTDGHALAEVTTCKAADPTQSNALLIAPRHADAAAIRSAGQRIASISRIIYASESFGTGKARDAATKLTLPPCGRRTEGQRPDGDNYQESD